VENDSREIPISEARKRNPAAQVGDAISETLPPFDFGRIAAQSAKQVIVQKVREAERDRQYQEYKDRIARVIRALDERGLHGLLMFHQESMYYLTGYDTFGFCFFQCLYLGTDGKLALLTRAPDLRQAQHTSILDDIAQLVADKLGLELDIQVTSWENWPLKTQSGDFEVVISNVGVNKDRVKLFDFEMDRWGNHIGGAEGFAWARIDALEELERTGRPVLMQDYRTGEARMVIVDQVHFAAQLAPSQQEKNFEGTASVTVRTVD
jgi:hypothetical protein